MDNPTVLPSIITGIATIIGAAITGYFILLRAKTKYSKKLIEKEGEIKRLEGLVPAAFEKQYASLRKSYDDLYDQLEDFKMKLKSSEDKNSALKKEMKDSFELFYNMINQSQKKLKEEKKSVVINVPVTKINIGETVVTKLTDQND